MQKPYVTVLIPTFHGSIDVVAIALESLEKQSISKDAYEIIIAHNGEKKDTAEIQRIAKKYNARVLYVPGLPSQACLQLNLGIRNAKGKYILKIDHDISLDRDLIKNFINEAENHPDVDAWYVPYKIITKNRILSKMRNFEEEFYKNSVIAAPRIFKKSTMLEQKILFDEKLNSGPADWDITNQFSLHHASFRYIKNYFYHHEGHLSLWQFISKKTQYASGGEIYKNKWKKLDSNIYSTVVKKQYGAIYRLFLLFIQNGNWKKLLYNFPLYLLFLAIKGSMAVIYLYSLRRNT